MSEQSRKQRYQPCDSSASRTKLEDEVKARRRAEKHLQILSAVVERRSEAIAVSDLEDNLIFVNEVFAAMVGYAGSELVGKHFSILHPPDQIAAVDAAERQVKKTGKFSGDLWHARRDGSAFPALVHKTLLREKAGKPIGILSMLHDITSHNETDQEKPRREKYLEALVEATQLLLSAHPDVPYQEFIERIGPASDASRVYVFLNHRDARGDLRTSQIAEWCREGIEPRIDNPQLQNYPYEPSFTRWQEVLSRGEGISGRVADFPESEREFLESQGIKAILVLPIIVDGEFVGFIGFDNCVSDREWETSEQNLIRMATYDLSEAIKRNLVEERIQHHKENLERLLKERTKQIREFEKKRREMEKLAATGRMAARVAHEINNPLAGIQNAFLLVKEAVSTDHPYYEYVDLIEKEITRISQIVRRMYELYRTEPQEPTLLDVSVVLRETYRMLDTHIRRRQLQVRMELAPDLPKIQISEGDLQQILYNLLLNAIQASPQEGELILTASEEEGKVRAAVTDHGEGIPPEVLPHIFEPFFSTKKEAKEEGMGLGLAVSYSLAAAAGGGIEVETEVGKGSTFTLVLPCQRDSSRYRFRAEGSPED